MALLLLLFVGSTRIAAASTTIPNENEMICERKTLENFRSVLVCTFVVEDRDFDDGDDDDYGVRRTSLQSCAYDSELEIDHCVEASVLVSMEPPQNPEEAEVQTSRDTPKETAQEEISVTRTTTAATESLEDTESSEASSSSSTATSEEFQTESKRETEHSNGENKNTHNSHQHKVPRNSESHEPIVVGHASYRPPYLEQYGSAVGTVLLDYHDRGFHDDDKPSMDLVEWYVRLGHAHMDDAEFGVVFQEEENGRARTPHHANHPKNYHIELALQAYTWASHTLFQKTSEAEFLEMDPAAEEDKDKMLRLMNYATIEYFKGEAYTLAGGVDAMHPSVQDEEFHLSALQAYRKAHAAFETLRYLYARLATNQKAASEGSNHYDYYGNNNDDNDGDDGQYYFNEDRYFAIEKYYADSCFQLGLSLYSKLILNQNAQILESNEKIMDLVKSKFGLEEDDLELVQSLLDQANGGMGGGSGGSSGKGGGRGGNSIFPGIESLADLSDLLHLGDDKGEDWNAALVEIAALLDTAILTYQQHANPSSSSSMPSSEKKEKRKFKVIVNGVPRKSIQELEEEERSFHWRASLVAVYQNAAVIATTRNQHIRSRELMNLALELYTDVIIPYYREQEDRDKRLKNTGASGRERHRSSPGLSSENPASLTTMTREFAEVSVGQLYVTLSDTSLKLGAYEDAKNAYAEAMNWHMEHKIMPASDGMFDSLQGDEASKHQYQEFATTYRQELDQYLQNVKKGYVYQDDSYEASMLLTIAPLYMALGQAQPAIRFYKDAIAAFERFVTDDLTNSSNRLAVLNVADARLGLSTAYFHEMLYMKSKEEHSLACQAYQKVYGEGTPPQYDGEGTLEEMKDMIVENYGEAYYEQLKTYYGDASGTGVGTRGSDGGNTNPKVAVKDFDVFGSNNETILEEDEYEDESDLHGEDGDETWSNDEL